MQRIQDFFADATGVASIIIRPDGTPITNPSNFCRLCNEIIRKTDIGLTNCIKSDAEIGRPNPSGPVIQPCLSGGLWDAGVSIIVGGKHIANWLIGQVKNEEL
ncbi:MAG: PocR ligand-binding domain-containing protein, partial [Chloroflexota bacterium]|nr:PocR ligand-binding domain-containing protein [Chloroflexota bacterium]